MKNKEKDKETKIKKVILWIFSFFVLNLLIMGFLTFQYTNILEKLDYSPDVEIDISPYLQTAPFGNNLSNNFLFPHI